MPTSLVLSLVLGLGVAAGQPADGTILVTDPAGDAGPLPDCEPGEASPPGAAEDIIAVEVADTADTRTVTVATDGDLSAAIATATDARVEVWVGSDDGSGVSYKFRRGVEASEPLDDVVDAENGPVDEAPVAVDAGPGGEAIFQFPFDLLDRLELLGDEARFGVVVVVGARCDKLGIGRVGPGFRLGELFNPVATAVVTTTEAPSVVTDTEPPATEVGDGGLSPWVIGLLGAGIILVVTVVRLGTRGAPGFGRASRIHCEALRLRCEELRQQAADAEAAVERAAADVAAANEKMSEARRGFIDARDAAREASDAADAAADDDAEGSDESNWVEGDEGRVTQGDLALGRRAAEEAQARYEAGEITAEQLEAEWNRLRGEEGRAELRRQRDARAKETAERAAAARAAENEANEAWAAAQAAEDAARQAQRDARAARDRARDAADAACREAEECFKNLEEGGIIPPPPDSPETADFGA